ncbi:hypothetical protein YC2023_015343 [Brassica napus]
MNVSVRMVQTKNKTQYPIMVELWRRQMKLIAMLVKWVEKLMSSIDLVWYKLPSEDMKDLNGEECLNKPREDDEGEESEDEQPLAEEEDEIQQEAGVQQEADKNDDGEEVVVDAGDGANDERFKSVFEEGAKTTAD